MMDPPNRVELERLRMAHQSGLKECRDRLNRISKSVKPETISGAVREHPVIAIAVAAAGGALLMQLLSLRTIRHVAGMATSTIARTLVATGFGAAATSAADSHAGNGSNSP